ncbi:DUF6078 family protein [Prevotella sp. KH2C16]|uniref:DUF6078 family protein n=1 Tax=Prevotella sp. KH2C16 TaxID=1855325 RepID=UPI0008E12B70|nr:DUF6078 family protein [Prevotella sp. KH2C16]SFG21218.1 hypothetical protein SAMN05216383_10748 [Prevotella sp. KH2C16]
MENKTLTTGISLRHQPKSWKHCFNENCKQKENCLRHLTGAALPDDKLCGMAVYPTACKGGACPFFRETRTINGAWGFANLFRNVREKDHAELRRRMKEYLGSNGTYYKYEHGTLLLTPDQQAWIIALFREFGYEEGLAFEHYEAAVDFRSGNS